MNVASAEGSGRLEGDGGGALVFGTSPLYTCRLPNYFRPFWGKSSWPETRFGGQEASFPPVTGLETQIWY